MSFFKALLTSTVLATTALFAQSFYVLTGVDNYDAIVANMSPKTAKYSADIKSLMQSMSKEIGVSIEGHPSRVLVFVIRDVSMGGVVGLEVKLELGEYVLREGSTQPVFGATYEDAKLIAPDFKDEEDVDDQLSDTVEEMLEKFKLQYIEDNKKLSTGKKSVTHETFAADMGYETNYKTALTKAKKEGKELMIFMTTSYCPWCRKLENRILSQNDIDAKIKAKYIPLMLNLDKDTYPEQFAKTRFTPILYIVNSKDESIEHKFVGYSNRGEFLQLLKENKN
ncbi:MAG: thioredoxin family protein [Epsilonproteobacteria bacterium]|nr:thioredoxin family protein [Campylobacterota bacterium]